MAVMSVSRRDETLNELARAIRDVRVTGSPSIRGASVEPYLDADGERALRAVIVLDAPEEGGWSAEFTHALRREVNRLAAERNLDEHVYIALFTEQEFSDRERSDDIEPVNTRVIDEALAHDQQDGS
ncbi:hypothetical protein [Planomonospora sp. ID82291]|uniref:hypothetical protein n=1 Tax=Planomonospora sp. ID82291 TaxID=2738136 RepID=UPI0018C3F0B1|nr:hypothetical protein [Planomonospora sp. ID82291]MBG0813719.1 hypothetical protein [Planomonospora sp. ID82291]